MTKAREVLRNAWAYWKARAEQAEARVKELEAERDRLTYIVNDRQDRGNEMLARAERAEGSIARVRALWPHIEIPNANASDRLGVPRTADPGAPTCLRCKIEAALRAPEGGE
jgi:hypothetical protein